MPFHQDPSGVPCSAPAASGQDVRYGAFWGENVQGARPHPIRIVDSVGRLSRDKVVYSPHSCE